MSNNPKAHAPNATQRSSKAKPIRAVPPKPEMRPADACFGPGEAERPGYALIPTLTRNGLVWPDTYDPAIHGEPAPRPGRAALDPDWWK